MPSVTRYPTYSLFTPLRAEDRSPNCYTFTSSAYRKSREKTRIVFRYLDGGLDVATTPSGYKFTLAPDPSVFVVSKRPKDATCVTPVNFLSCPRCSLKTGFLPRRFLSSSSLFLVFYAWTPINFANAAVSRNLSG